ncbi:MAG: rRNA maturation RNase YbeY [Nitratireductor sp.]|nr:rRNA maturation RNase YbeY [Nitratireductor sp.]
MNRLEISISVNDNGWPGEAGLLALCERAVSAAAASAGLDWPDGAELSLLFTNDAEMAVINGEWRDKPVATNVLSFPGGDVQVGEPAGPVLGDLVFARETVEREAAEQEKSFEDHLTHLAVHGFLHLFGYDHIDDDEAEEMEEIERQTLSGLGIADPYA